MKTRLLTLLAAASATAYASSAPLTPDAALQRALESSSVPAKMATSSARQLRCHETIDIDGQAAIYVFSSGIGYLVLPADDAAAPVLGYSDEGEFTGEMPDGMRWWLDNCARELAAARAAGAKAPRRLGEEKAPIAPICTTKWNQGAPYNNECPVIGNTRAITGCVATAMAQVMKAHNWPNQGEGRKSYFCNALSTRINMVFENTTFDWDNMLDVYGTANDEQKLAVATLMKACGYSVEMDYTTGACGAQSFNVALALPKYFKYDQGIKYVLRDFYGATEWEDLLYAELEAGRPIYYSGSNSETGHAFVFDGYQPGGFFHVNWGWGGQSDGYFMVNGLDPSSQGLGGSNAGYNNWQEVILNVKPRQEGVDSPTYRWMGAYDFNFETDKVKLGEAAVVTSWFYNYSIEQLTGTFGLKLSKADGEAIYLTDGTPFTNLGLRSGKSGQVVLPADLPEGQYTVTAGFTDKDGVWHDNRIAVYAVQAYAMEVAGGYATFTPCPTATVKFSDISASPLYVGANFVVKATVSNDTPFDFFKGVHMSVRDSKGKEALRTQDMRLDLSKGDCREFELMTKFSADEGAVIDYEAEHMLYFLDDQDNVLSEGFPIVVHAESKPQVTIGAAYMADGNSTEVDPHNICIKADVSCVNGFFAEDLYMWIFSYSSKYGAQGSAVAGMPAGMMFLTAGEEATATFALDFENAKPKGRYIGQIWYNGWVPNGVVFRISDFDGVAAVAEDEEPVAEDFFTLQGSKADRLLPGNVYLKVSRYADGSQETEKVIAR